MIYIIKSNHPSNKVAKWIAFERNTSFLFFSILFLFPLSILNWILVLVSDW